MLNALRNCEIISSVKYFYISVKKNFLNKKCGPENKYSYIVLYMMYPFIRAYHHNLMNFAANPTLQKGNGLKFSDNNLWKSEHSPIFHGRIRKYKNNQSERRYP